MSKITEILSLARFPEEARECFENALAHIESDAGLSPRLCELEKAYMAGEDTKTARTSLSEVTGIHIHTLEMLLLLCCAVTLRGIYRDKGYDDELFCGVLTDLRCKLTECKNVKGIWGTFVFSWFFRFYNCTRFMLGRLQYETVAAKYDYKDVFKAGDTVYNCHIPSSGPLTPELVEESLRLAREFYGVEGAMPVVCHSWLLYPKHYELFGANTRAFAERFDVINTDEQENNGDAWRIFGRDADDLEALPQNTSLQREFYRYIKDGNKMGNGYGVLLYSPSDKK
jgi:hypothetical protein